MRRYATKIKTWLLIGAMGGLLWTAPLQAGSIGVSPTLDPNSNDFVLLDDLVSGESPGVIVGDKCFTEFFYSGLGDMPDAQEVKVYGFEDVNGNFGLSFHGTFIDLPGSAASDALLRFTVSVMPDALQQGYRISDAHLFMGGAGAGDNSVVTVDESFQENDETLNVFFSTLGEGGQQTSDWVFFDEVYESLRVTKDIFALAGSGSIRQAGTSVIDQSFSQTREPVPEPVTAVLMTLGALSLANLARRERSPDVG